MCVSLFWDQRRVVPIRLLHLYLQQHATLPVYVAAMVRLLHSRVYQLALIEVFQRKVLYAALQLDHHMYNV